VKDQGERTLPECPFHRESRAVLSGYSREAR
jgi:hypothetical protein